MTKMEGKVQGFASLPFPEPGEELVISGIAGRYPESDNLTHLQENFFNKVDMVTDDDRRWKLDHPQIPQRGGKVNHLGKFDAEFFGVNFKEAHTMDPMSRILLEHTVEAIIDAGVNPRQLRGTNTGVFIGCCYSESEKGWMYTTYGIGGVGLTGCCRAMMANRISNWLGCTGPSYTLDTACSSSLFAMDQAYRAIRTGECDDALVAACNLCLHPNVSRQFFLLGVLSADGRCKSFDAAGDGYARSEAISVIYLQKSKNAKRVYANVIYTKTNNDGYKEEGITFPSSALQHILLEQFYEECKVPPCSLAYLEAHGTGTYAGDPVEVDAIDRVFCRGRTTPLRIGSVKSNMGHAEPASGLCAIAKVIIAMESGYIPPNLHFNHPREGMKALEEGRIQVITELTPWEGGYAGINSFGFGGGNAHVLLKSNPKEKINNGRPSDNMSRLVLVSGRTEEAVTTLLDDLESRPVDVEYVALFHNIHSEEISGHLYRGYTILPPLGSPEKRIRDVQRYSGEKRPVYFMFSGIGSQWPGMGDTLLKIPVFAKAVQKCDAALEYYDLNITDILTSKDPKIFHNILNAFVGNAAMQIGLVDVLASIRIVPDNIIGYSIGELGCAYADGCLTAEQVILASYFQGLALIGTESIRGQWAASKSENEEPKYINMTGVKETFVGCSNNREISASIKSTKEFVHEKEKYNLAKYELYRNITHESRYVETIKPKLLTYLQHVIPDPKPRSQKWLGARSSDASQNNSAHLCSPEYHTDHFVNPVLFEEISHLIPNNAITIEITPHGLVQSTLLRSLNENVTNIVLTERGPRNSFEVLLHAIGKMYEVGLHPKLANLYPSVQFPVSRGTPMISPLLRWDHSENWTVMSYQKQTKIDSTERFVEISLAEEAFEWMAGHVIDGRNLVPATGYLILIWETLSMVRGEIYSEISVVFEDVRFHRATAIPKKGDVRLNLMIQRASGRFEIFEGDTVVVSGYVRAVTNPAKERLNSEKLIHDEEELNMTGRDFYKELRLRGYQYSGLFRGVKEASIKGTQGRIAWENNWVTFMDNMLQMLILGMDTRGLFVPTGIQKLVIDTKMHMNQLRVLSENDTVLPVKVYKDLGIITCGGVEIRGLKASAIARKKPAGEPVLEKLNFVAHRDRAAMELSEITRIVTHLALENHFSVKIETVELISEADDVSPDELTSPLIRDILGDLPLLQADINVIAPVHKVPDNALPSSIKISELKNLTSKSSALLVIGRDLLANNDTETLKLVRTVLKVGGFFMAREPLDADVCTFSILNTGDFDIVLEKSTKKELVILLRKREQLREIASVIQVHNDEFTWLPTLQAALKVEAEKQSIARNRILLFSQGDIESGLMGLVNCLRKEPGGEVIQGLLIQDPQAPKFSLENPLYANQLKLGLALNVLRPGNVWGSYRFSAIDLLPVKPVYHARLNQHTRGDLNALRWVEGPIQPSSSHNNIIQVHYSPLNFRDVMLATGKIPVEVAVKTRREQENVLGFEYSGKDSNGRAVMGMLGCGAFSNVVHYDKDFLWQVPDTWTLEDAATVPVVYGTAYYALFLCAGIKKEHKILIHAGTGGVGQAAITLALNVGCEVFTTVGTPEKREFIRTQFPEIDDEHIGNSRDTSFEQLVLRKTRGRGVDIVLNSLSEEKLKASIRCLAEGGRFLEIGKFDLAENNLIGLEPFLKGISYHGLFLDNLLNNPSGTKLKIAAMLTEGLKSSAIKPLIRTVFPMDQTEAAFRYMAAGKHIGKVIVKVRNEDDGRMSEFPLATPRYYCFGDRSYLILGGLGGFGLELADWLVLRGAKKLVLTSRKGISNGYQRMRIHIWKSYGVEIVIVVGKDASTPEGCEDILREAITLGPVDAIFNLAVVLKDSLFEDQTVETFEESFRVKAWATKQFDKLSRKLCPDLRQFVVFSSVSCGRGNAGQTNYGMANSVMERICEARKADGLPGLAVEWGAVGDVGLVAEMQEDDKELVIGGTLQQKISSCLQELDGFLQQDSPVVASMVVAEKNAGGAGITNMVDAVLHLMDLKDLKSISLHTPLSELGMDSMMAVEIKQTLEREYEVFLTAADIRSLNFAKLVELNQKQALTNGTTENDTKDETKEIAAGLRLLIRTLGKSQAPEKICVPLVSKSHDARGENFIVPGIEGSYTVVEPLACKLQSSTTCLQFGTDFVNLTSITDIADHLLPYVRKRSKGCKDFVVAGYSFGSLVAIELVRRLESEGFRGRLVLIDGSPDYMKEIINQFVGGDKEDEIESNMLIKMMDIIHPAAVRQLIAKFQGLNGWDEKLTAFLEHIPENENFSFTREDHRAMCTAIYHRFKAVLNYDSSAFLPLTTPITLLRPTISAIRIMSEDYGLKSLTLGTVNAYDVKGDHVTILDDDVCAAAIDGRLDENVEVCNSRNL